MRKITHEGLKEVANTIRGLAMDGVQKAKSGHPGMPMGMADVAAVLYLRHLRHCPSNPAWPDRDRFVLSAGHGSMLIYSMLHLSGYDLPTGELQAFRQYGSRTPGHPEYRETPGVETTTGPLGQGCGNAVGMAIAERMMAARYNTDDATLFDHRTYVIASDGDLMEGISHEAFALAGHLGLGKLVVFYDDNHITIEGGTDLAYSDDVRKRFEGYHWNVLEVDGHDFDQIESAIEAAKAETQRPTIVICHTHIGYGSPNKQDTNKSHGEPLGDDEVAATKRALGLPADRFFYVSDSVHNLFQARMIEMQRDEEAWNRKMSAYRGAHADKAAQLDAAMSLAVPENIEKLVPQFDLAKPVSTRAAAGKVQNALGKSVKYLVGGSADLAPSTRTLFDGEASIAKGKFSGRNFHFGVREHGMAAIMNGMALHGGFRVFGSTFFVFFDYCRPSVRLASLMKLPVIYVFTHDSIFVGEDGPTHEPVEQAAALRCIPDITVLRPSDATESAAAWVAALKHVDGPVAMLLTRHDIPVIDRAKYASASLLEKGAYTLWQSAPGTPDIILIGTGSELWPVLQAGEELGKECRTRVVSMPSWELFEKQAEVYKQEVLPSNVTCRLAVEAGRSFGWHRYIGPRGRTIAIDTFGRSGPYKVLGEKYGFTAANVLKVAREMLAAK